MLVTHREDLTADWLVVELHRRGAPFVRVNTEDYPTRCTLCWTPLEAWLQVGEKRLHASEVDAVWWRRPLAPQLPADLSPQEALWAAGEAQAAIEGFWRSVDAHWVNPPMANAAADCKPEQLRRASALGFDVPASLVSNDTDAARAFSGEHERVICKTLREGVVPVGDSSGAFYTEPVNAEHLSALGGLGPEPYLFQELVEKRYDIRVTVIGERVLACRIESQEQARTDWRKADAEALPHAVEEVPPEIARRCALLAGSYGLRFAAIDLARRTDGGYTFFELNPNGQWAWVEQLTGLPLRSALADELTGTHT
jgi:glutathione synthase/RimK-type ligase-like ATP-grasp enzyme